MSYKEKTYEFNGLALSLVSNGLIDKDAMQESLIKAKKDDHNIVKYLVDNSLIDPKIITETISVDYGLPVFNIDVLNPRRLPVNLIKEQYILKDRILPLIKQNDILYVAVADPSQQVKFNDIEFHTGLKVRCILTDSQKLDQFIEKALINKNFKVLEDCVKDADNPLDESIYDNEEILNSIDDAPMVKFVHNILTEAIDKKASDIHFEPYNKDYRVRFRIDGVLYEVNHPPAQLANRISSRLKIMSSLDISEKRIPQDGRCKLELSEEKTIDFRINTCPTVNGEKIVLRILDSQNTTLGVNKLGFNPQQNELFLDAINKPQGMILVTGPTGSGKTVTLYTALNILNSPEQNISTAEDPVEIKLEGINQIQINPKINFTFSKALRAFLRQDPDIIMVGEIRDIETAEIGIKAAQTGHLVLSTLHTNSAPESVIRLLNMGVKTFNITSTLSLVIAQRLARKLCDQCKESYKLDNKTLKKIRLDNPQLTTNTIYKAVGCKHCTNGYKGRIGLFEVLPINSAIGKLIMKGTSSEEIVNEAKKDGFISIYQSGLTKVNDGTTSLEEIHRVTVA